MAQVFRNVSAHTDISSFETGGSQAKIAGPLSDNARTGLVLLALLLVIAVQAVVCPRQLVEPLDLSGNKLLELDGRVMDEPRRPQAGELRFVFDTTIDGKPARLLLSGPDLPWDADTQIRRGDRLRAKARLWSIMRRADDDSPFSYAAYLRRRGIQARGQIVKQEQRVRAAAPETFRGHLVDDLARRFPEGEAIGALLAMNLAETDLLSTEIRELFRRTSTSHLLVVSGLHVGCVFVLLLKLLEFALGRSVWLLSRLPLEIPTSLLALLGAGSFVGFIGWPLSAVRALIFLAVYVAGRVLARRALTLRTLFLAYLLILSLWPGAFFEVSSQLTFAAILGLIAGGAINSRCFEGVRFARLKKAFTLNTMAWLFTAPVIWIWFESFSPLGIFWNFLSVAAFSLVGISLGGTSLLLFATGLPFSDQLLRLNLMLLNWLLLALERAEALTQGTVFEALQSHWP